METGTFRVKSGLAEMLKGGVIMDVVTPEQAKIAEDAGAAAVMALERVPADIRRDGGVARMSDPTMIEGIKEAVSIPVMAKARIGHFVEAQVLEALDVDYIDESEVLTPADEAHHIDKWAFKVPFVCGATNLGEALRRIAEGAAMIRSKGEAGTGNVVEAVRHIRLITGEIRRLPSLSEMELPTAAKELQAPLELVKDVAEKGRLPVVLFCAGGIATPADAALMMQLGAEGNFVGSGIFKSSNPEQRARAIVEATTHYNDPERDRGRLARAGRRDAGHRDRHAPGERRAAPAPRLVTSRRPRPPGGLRGAREGLAASAPTVREVRTPRGPRRPRRPGHPRRRVHDHRARRRARGPRRAADRVRAQRQAGARDLRGDDHAGPRAPRGARHRRTAQRLRPSAGVLRGRAELRRHAHRCRLHPGSLGRGRRGRGWRFWPRWTGIRSRFARETSSPSPFTPS